VRLVDIQPETTDLLQGVWRIDGTTYKQSVGCRDCQSGEYASYRLEGRYQRFVGTLATVSPYEAKLTVTLDRLAGVTRVATAGHPIEFSIDVTGVQAITIELDTGDCCELVVIGQARFEAW